VASVEVVQGILYPVVVALAVVVTARVHPEILVVVESVTASLVVLVASASVASVELVVVLASVPSVELVKHYLCHHLVVVVVSVE
jgi:hypothetical protein